MRVLCISGSRADYGGIEATYKALEKIGVDTHLRNIGNIALSHNYDLAVVLGDRFEVLSTVFDLFINKIPIAHLSGGDVTEGSQDDCMRHAITKLSHLHFPTNEDSAKRIIQMGEEPWRVHVVGYPGVDGLQTYDKEVATKLVGAEDFILVVWHPNTLTSEVDAYCEAELLTKALDQIQTRKLVISPNKDSGGCEIANLFEEWCAKTGNRYLGSLPRDMYLTCLKHCKCLVGNSSSGFYEAPSFGTPVVNIGDRQKGRNRHNKLVQARLYAPDIEACIHAVLMGANLDLLVRNSTVGNIYQTGNASDKITEVIANIKEPKKLLLKKFCDINYT